jgi:hypothetical protein
MNVEAIADMIMNQGIWCALFCYLFYSVRKEAKEDKERLMELLTMQSDKLKEITMALDKLSDKIK